MWKWLGGCLLVVIVMVVIAMMWGIRTMKESLSPDGSAAVTIAATPARVFATLNHGDSAATWMAEGSTVLTSRHGPLVPGDTLRIELSTRMRMPNPQQQTMVLRVKEVVPGQLMAFDLIAAGRVVIATRRDSIAAFGDSTRVTTRIQPRLDSLAANRSAKKGKSSSGTSALAFDFMVSIIRMQSKLELMKLKTRLEGVPAAAR